MPKPAEGFSLEKLWVPPRHDSHLWGWGFIQRKAVLDPFARRRRGMGPSCPFLPHRQRTSSHLHSPTSSITLHRCHQNCHLLDTCPVWPLGRADGCCHLHSGISGQRQDPYWAEGAAEAGSRAGGLFPKASTSSAQHSSPSALVCLPPGTALVSKLRCPENCQDCRLAQGLQ